MTTERRKIGTAPSFFVEMSPDAVTFRLLPGEKLVASAKNVTHICPYDGPVFGTLYVTNYKLVFENGEGSDRKAKRTTEWKGISPLAPSAKLPGPEIPLGMISQVNKIGGQSNKAENGYCLELVCNDWRTLRFGFIPENHSRKHIYEQLMTHAFPASNELEFFAFIGAEKFELDGWALYHATEELNRVIGKNEAWRVTSANVAYTLCDTYPAFIGVPSSVDDLALDHASKFRTKNRLPALSWVHPTNRASITRCSQPKVGPWRRNEQDESLIKAIRETNPNNQKLVIVDARPKVNAVANQAKGAGYENTEVYENTEILFMNIPNIHVIRESHKKLRDCCFPRTDDVHWYAKLEETRWLEYTRLILQSVVTVVDMVYKQGTSVLIHCSDGWDRTPQITSLSMMLLDPYYRTLRGFCVLVEKEWIAFSHKFMQRFGQGNKNHADEQRAPIFIQFLDCVFQLLIQFPCSFEFNEAFLQALGDEVYTCRFGTFLFNSEHQRIVENRVKEKTLSLWSFLLSAENHALFKNPLYLPSAEVLLPVVTARHMRLWTNCYLRWLPKQTKPDLVNERHQELRNVVDDLQQQVQTLESELSSS